MKATHQILSFVLLISSPMLWADNSEIVAAARSQTSKEVQQQQTQVVKESHNNTYGTSTINDAAARGRSSQNAGQMLNMIASAAMFAACAASCPSCRMELCVMGAQAAMQAGKDAGAANMSDMTFDASEFNPGDYTAPDGTDGLQTAGDGTGDADFDNPVIKDGMDKLAESGYKVTEQGVEFPDGSMKPHSAFDSPQSMMNAGIDPATAQLAGEVVEAINGELNKSGANVVAMGIKSGGGGSSGYGSGAGAADFGDLDSFSLPKLKNPFDKTDKKKLLAGKSVMAGGEPIGVKGDNIFDMVHRAYQKKRGKKMFFETTKESMRLPASLTRGGGS